MTGWDLRAGPHPGSVRVVVVFAQRDPSNHRGVLTDAGAERPGDVGTRALDQLGVYDRPRVRRARHRVAVKVALLILPKRVILQDGCRNQPPQVPRGHELLPALLLCQVPGDDQRRGRRPEPRRGEQVPLSRILQRGVTVGVHVSQTPRRRRGKHESPAPLSSVALHPVHLHEGRVPQDDHLGEGAELSGGGRVVPLVVLLVSILGRGGRLGDGGGVPREAFVLPGFETPRVRRRAPRLAHPGGHLRETREVRDRPFHRLHGKEQLDSVQVPSRGSGGDWIEPLGDPSLRFGQADGADGRREVRDAARGAREARRDVRVGKQGLIRPVERQRGRPCVLVPQLHVVSQAHESHPEPVFGALHLGAVHDDAVDAVVVVGFDVRVPAPSVDALGAGLLPTSGVGAVGSSEGIAAGSVLVQRNVRERLRPSGRFGLDVRRQQRLAERRDEVGHLPNAVL